MNRALTCALLLLAAACSSTQIASDSNQAGKNNNASQAAAERSTTNAAGLRFNSYQFETVTVNAKGREDITACQSADVARPHRRRSKTRLWLFDHGFSKRRIFTRW